jgi:3-isopropylmalate/(R)-2-methylmalate dehydratase small subunit
LLKALGISIIVSDSMSRLFFRNAVNTGLPVLICKGVSAVFEEGDLASVNMETGEVKNLTKKTSITGEALPKGSPPLEIIKKGGLLAYLQNESMEENP